MNLEGQYLARATGAEYHDIKAQMPVLYAWAHSARKIIELGVRGGNSTAAFLAGLERAGNGGQLWSVDIQEPVVPKDWHKLPFWHLLVADDLSAEAVTFCPPDADVLFVDTSHLYEHTMAELRRYMPRVRPGGIALFHDTDPHDWPDVSRALDDFCEESERYVWYEHPFWHGLGVIEVPVP